MLGPRSLLPHPGFTVADAMSGMHFSEDPSVASVDGS